MGDSLNSKMLLKTSLTLLLLSLALSSGRPKKSEQRAKKEEMLRNGRLDVALKSRDHGFVKPGQGDCPEGWADGTSVGLGCVLPDLNDESVDEPTAETVCKNFGEGGRLVEILNMEQLHFLQNLLGGIENENQMDGYAYWWIGLNDVETESGRSTVLLTSPGGTTITESLTTTTRATTVW